jgi:SpoIID/LytB domain protein
MPATWPFEALKAQAVTARSDVLLHLGLKRGLEGFHFTDGEGDRVYVGHSGRHPMTDAAVSATRGFVLADNDRIVPAVFSANCGGWTEDNDTVWSGPPDPNLRGIPDFSGPAAMSPTSNCSTWVRSRPNAYCATDVNGFRWSRRLTATELTRLVNTDFHVGVVGRVESGERGTSGRLKWVRIVGDEGSVTVRKELAIRRAFGGLPSAMFIIEVETGPSGPVAFTFHGGGRGHGVGLCQYGARGMALEGRDWRAIVSHYFPVSRVEVLR